MGEFLGELLFEAIGSFFEDVLNHLFTRRAMRKREKEKAE